MLSKEEENRLENICEVIGTESLDCGFWEFEEFKWAISRLKEINEETSRVHLELQKANEELAKVYGVYGP